MHAYWPIEGGAIGEKFPTGQARALLRRWHRLVAVVAGKLDIHVDNVYDLPRMLRLPGTFNNKSRGNGADAVPVVAYADTGGPLTWAEVDERLTEMGICPEADDTADDTIVSDPPGWEHRRTRQSNWPSGRKPIRRHLSLTLMICAAHRRRR